MLGFVADEVAHAAGSCLLSLATQQEPAALQLMQLDGKGQRSYWDGIRASRKRIAQLKAQRLSVLGPARPKPTTSSADYRANTTMPQSNAALLTNRQSNLECDEYKR